MWVASSLRNPQADVEAEIIQQTLIEPIVVKDARMEWPQSLLSRSLQCGGDVHS